MQLLVDAAHRQGLTVAGIVDSDYWGNTEIYAGQLVIGTEKDFDDPEKLKSWTNEYDFFIATNWSPDPAHDRDRNKKKYLIDLVERVGIKCINLIDPSVYIGSRVKLGNGIYIGYNVYIEFNCEIESFCLIHYDVGMSHGVTIGKNTIVHCKCGLGNSTIGKDVYIGPWTNIFTSARHTTVGDGAFIHQALWVVRDVAEGEQVRLTRDAVRTYKNITEV
jgi:NDP-sugar pyrophosphorylase family protein